MPIPWPDGLHLPSTDKRCGSDVSTCSATFLANVM